MKPSSSVEKAIQAVKQWLRGHAQEIPAGLPLALRARVAIAELNHQSRAVLGGRNSCEVFFQDSMAKQYHLQQRKELKLWIQHAAADIIRRARRRGRAVSAAAAWRKAVRIWLELHGLIVITPRAKSVTLFSKKVFS